MDTTWTPSFPLQLLSLFGTTFDDIANIYSKKSTLGVGSNVVEPKKMNGSRWIKVS
jgi:hypothetical protein